MRPKTEKTYVDQVLNNGKGVTWLDDCRIPFKDNNDIVQTSVSTKGFGSNMRDDNWQPPSKPYKESIKEGRFPANLLVSDDSLNDHSKLFDLDAWFAIFPKPSKSEKIKGVESNTHPTVKPIKLMSYLITLGSRPDEIVLDPFMGSGATGISAKLTGRNFIGYEMEEEYYQIAEARIDAWEEGAIGRDKEGRPEDKKDGKKQSDGSRIGQTSITSY